MWAKTSGADLPGDRRPCHRQVRDREEPGPRSTAGPRAGTQTHGRPGLCDRERRRPRQQVREGGRGWKEPLRPRATPRGAGEGPPAAHHRTGGSFCSPRRPTQTRQLRPLRARREALVWGETPVPAARRRGGRRRRGQEAGSVAAARGGPYLPLFGLGKLSCR